MRSLFGDASESFAQEIATLTIVIGYITIAHQYWLSSSIWSMFCRDPLGQWRDAATWVGSDSSRVTQLRDF